MGLSALFSSPDEKPITIASWANADPADFTATAAAELAGTSTSAGYGPPYNTASTGQNLGPFSTSANTDALIWGLMGLLTLAFVLPPFIPGLRSIPRLIPVYRLIWRDHYRTQRATHHE